MRHLLICREYPPAPSGGIGTYSLWISRLLAAAGETVHVIGQMWKGAESVLEEQCGGKLIVHRIPHDSWRSLVRGRPHPSLPNGFARNLFKSGRPAQCFSWQASLLAERLVSDEGIDIIEAQEYEAPLYYYQLRRAQGLDLKPSPPCLVHLHSPSEFIGRNNGWRLDLPELATAIRLEQYSIAAADALLCPSRFLAASLERHYEIPSGSVRVIRYPLGECVYLERDQETWEAGAICYIGRLEPRKGIMEWINAAVGAARRYPAVKFEFAGSNALGNNRISGEYILSDLIPRDVKSKFIFHGEQNRSFLNGLMKRARVVAVPSRWDNFPYSCIEAMASGLPVLASREGGMAEMIRDGETGWIAPEVTSAGLGLALERALAMHWTGISDMGREAARAINLLCDNAKVLETHIALRHHLANQRTHKPRKGSKNLSPPRHSNRYTVGSHAEVFLETQGSRKVSQKWLLSNSAYALRHPLRTLVWLSKETWRRWAMKWADSNAPRL